MALSASAAAAAFLLGAGLGSYCTAWVLVVGSALAGMAGLGVCVLLPNTVALHPELLAAAVEASLLAETGFLAAAATRIYVFGRARA